METTRTPPRVWLGCLACYNAGTLFGGWIDAAEAVGAWEEDRLEVVSLASERARHAAGNHEEWWCFDCEGFGDLLGECSPAEAQRLVEVIDRVQATPDELPAFLAFAYHVGMEEPDDLPDHFREAYAGRWDSVAEYASDLAEDTWPNESRLQDLTDRWPFTCIDWERAAGDLVLGGDIWTAEAESGVFVFRAV